MRSVVVGRVNASAWTGQDGQPRASLEVTAESVRFLGGRGDGNGGGGVSVGAGIEAMEDEEEIPFVRPEEERIPF
jgi:single-stranded DNA-binding protein